MQDATARRLAASGAILTALALVTGLLAGGAMTDKIPGDGAILLAAHLAGLMGAFMIFGLGWSLPMVQFSAASKSRLAWFVILPNFANWLVTTIKGFLRVHGLDFGPTTADTIVFVTLNVLVVVPILVATVAWAVGLLRKPA